MRPWSWKDRLAVTVLCLSVGALAWAAWRLLARLWPLLA